jgi:hypothetical protein
MTIAARFSFPTVHLSLRETVRVRELSRKV